MRAKLLLALLAAAAAFSPARIRAEEECRSCKGKGETACRLHRPPTAFQFKHSLWFEYECCLGTGKRPCKKCEPEAIVRAFMDRRRALAEWVQERRANVDVCLFASDSSLSGLAHSATIRHAESENFRLISTSPSLPVRPCDVPEGLFPGLPSKKTQKRNFHPEHYDWICLKRCEDAFKDYKAVFLNRGHFPSAATNYHGDVFKAAEGKYDVFLWDRAGPHLVCGRVFFGMAEALGHYKHGVRMTAVVGKENYTKNDAMLHRYLTHVLHHLFIEAYEIVIGFEMPSWVPEGFAHYMEWKKFGNFRITCYFERPGPVSIPAKVKDAVLKLVLSGKALPASSVIKLGYNTMDAKAHLQIWSFFPFLIEGTPRETFIRFIQGLKRSRDQLQAFKEAYGYSLIMIDEPWKKFVLKNYR
ncbi:MAG: hypothetical protein ACYS47_10795 [Planctomycetota bacterium]|jgi:hypothetical protein